MKHNAPQDCSRPLLLVQRCSMQRAQRGDAIGLSSLNSKFAGTKRRTQVSQSRSCSKTSIFFAWILCQNCILGLQAAVHSCRKPGRWSSRMKCRRRHQKCFECFCTMKHQAEHSTWHFVVADLFLLQDVRVQDLNTLPVYKLSSIPLSIIASRLAVTYLTSFFIIHLLSVHLTSVDSHGDVFIHKISTAICFMWGFKW